jgi:ADP-heptose:LPS heptosyltransferase
MCPPVRHRYAGESGANRAREGMLRLLRWQSARRLERTRRAGAAGAAEHGGARIPPDARILAVQPDNLGGALLTTAAYRLIKTALPTAYLTVLSGPWAEDVPRHCPAVDRVRTCRFPGFDRPAVASGRAFDPLARARQALRPYALLLSQAAAESDEGYDVAVNFHADFWWGAALIGLAGVPHRIGYAAPEAAAFLSRALPLDRLPVGKATAARPRPHVAEMHLAAAREVLALANRQAPVDFDGRMSYEPAADERGEAWRLWRTYDLDEASGVIAVHPAPGAAAKRWPAERFAWLIDHIAGRYGATAVVTGGPGDVDEARAIAAACRHRPVVLAGQTSVGVLAALLDRCKLVVGTDNGALHLASARGRPTLRLFGPTDAASWGAWPAGERGGPPAAHVVSARACAPCHRLDLPAWDASLMGGGAAYPCMAEITADQVIAAVEHLWPQLG